MTTELLYWYPSSKRQSGKVGHLVKAATPGRSLCFKFLLQSGIVRDRPLPGYPLCEKCKARRKEAKSHVNLNWDQVDPRSEDFMRMTPEDRMKVLAARQAARERNRES